MFCFFTGDNLVVIAGRDSSRLNDVEHVSIQNNNNLCDPMDLDYIVSYGKQYGFEGPASVATHLGILTCGGRTGLFSIGRIGLSLYKRKDYTSKCTLQTKEGNNNFFPSMRKTRAYFGLGIINDLVFAVGGLHRRFTTMEKINYKTDSEWTLTYLPFSVSDHCLTTTTSSIVITGGQYYDGTVSKIILSF